MKLSILDLLLPDGRINGDLSNYVMMKQQGKGCPIFNFNGIVMIGKFVNNLMPLPNVMQLLRESNFGDENTRDFDIAYANQLLTYQPSFIDLMQIMGSLQFSDETFLLCDMVNTNMANITESLTKFIYERYSINLFIVKDVMDIDELKFSDFQTETGYNNYIQDMDRFKISYFTKEQLSKEVVV